MSQARVLVVDDEPVNLMLIESLLEQETLVLEAYSDPVEAWERLQAPETDFSAIILDRMMPRLDGLELLRRIRREARFSDVPVIIQTAAAAPDQVREGLESGAYYYLTKPYPPEALLSIVRAALDDHEKRVSLGKHVARLTESGRLLVCAEYRFVSLEDVNNLVPVLAAFCDEPGRVAPGLTDLMVNAVEHGNLGITYEEKTALRRSDGWEAEVERRLTLSPYRERVATVRIEKRGGRTSFTIQDQGEGFDWRPYLDFDPQRAFDPNGRGIAMARLTCFSALDYLGTGNTVVAVV